ncbi:MAG: hypothetical protein R2864_07675 [Syntrophotaleaceae bacterium]
MLRKLSLAYTGGTVAALTACLVFWLLGRDGVTAWLGIGLAPRLTPCWLYGRLIFGGLCGLLLVLPILPNRVPLRGMLISLAPAAYILLVYFPRAGGGCSASATGALTRC